MEKNGTAALQNRLAVSLKTKNATPIQSSDFSPGHLSQQYENLCLHKNLYTNVYISFIVIAQNWKKKKDVFQWVNECTQGMVYPYLINKPGWSAKELCWVGKKNPNIIYRMISSVEHS